MTSKVFVLAQSEYIISKTVDYVNLSKLSIYELQVIFFIGETMMIVTKR